MTSLPLKTFLTGATTTEGQFQSALGQLYDFIGELATAGAPESHELVGDRFTPTKGYVIIEAEGTAVIDNLSGIYPTGIGEKVLFLTVKSGNTITLRHNISGSGKLSLREGADVVMSDPNQLMCLRYIASDDTWYESLRNWGVFAPSATDKSTALTALGIKEIATRTVGTSAGMIPAIEMLGALALKNSVVAGDIADGSITENKTALSSIALTKLKASTANTLVGFATNGAPVNITAGSGVQISGGVISSTAGTGSQIYKVAGNHSFTVPAGVTKLKCWAIGGGGGSGGVDFNNATPKFSSVAGGTSSIGTFCSAFGGTSNMVGGLSSYANVAAVLAGFNYQGSSGDSLNPTTAEGGMPYFMGKLGPGAKSAAEGIWPGGGGAGVTRAGYTNGVGAGGGGAVMIYLSVTPGQVINIVVGAGGPGGSGSFATGKNGAAGLVLIEW